MVEQQGHPRVRALEGLVEEFSPPGRAVEFALSRSPTRRSDDCDDNYCVRSHTNMNTLALRNATQPTKSFKYILFGKSMQNKNVFSKTSPEISPGFHTQLEVVQNKIYFS